MTEHIASELQVLGVVATKRHPALLLEARQAIDMKRRMPFHTSRTESMQPPPEASVRHWRSY